VSPPINDRDCANGLAGKPICKGLVAPVMGATVSAGPARARPGGRVSNVGCGDAILESRLRFVGRVSISTALSVLVATPVAFTELRNQQQPHHHPAQRFSPFHGADAPRSHVLLPPALIC